MTSLPSVHPQSFIPAISRVTENKWAMSPQTLSFGFWSSSITVASYPATVPIQQRPSFSAACAKAAHNSTQRLTIPGHHARDNIQACHQEAWLSHRDGVRACSKDVLDAIQACCPAAIWELVSYKMWQSVVPDIACSIAGRPEKLFCKSEDEP